MVYYFQPTDDGDVVPHPMVNLLDATVDARAPRVSCTATEAPSSQVAHASSRHHLKSILKRDGQCILRGSGPSRCDAVHLVSVCSLLLSTSLYIPQLSGFSLSVRLFFPLLLNLVSH